MKVLSTDGEEFGAVVLQEGEIIEDYQEIIKESDDDNTDNG